MLSLSPAQETIGLTANGALNIPATSLRGNYPDGSEAELVFTDGAGITLLTLDGDFSSGKGISFYADPSTVSKLAAGTNFVVYVTLPGLDPVAYRYGTVIRLEPSYPLAAPSSSTDLALQFTADFSGDYLGPQFIPMGGTSSISIHDNSAKSLANSLGPDYDFFNTAATRWFQPMNMDSVTVEASVLNMGSGAFGYGVYNLVVCADYQMANYLGVQIYIDAIPANSYVQAITGKGPIAWTKQGSQVSNQVANNDAYIVKYDVLTNTLSCYKNNGLTPILSWVDSAGLVPHGEGFRYTGMSWQTSLFNSVCEPTAWQAHDGV